MSLRHNPARSDEFKHDARWYLMPVAATVVTVLLLVHGLVTVPDSPGDIAAITAQAGLAEAVAAP